MNDRLRLDGLRGLCSGVCVETTEGNAEGGAMDMGAGVEARAGAGVLKLPKPLVKSKLSWVVEVQGCSSGIWDGVSLSGTGLFGGVHLLWEAVEAEFALALSVELWEWSGDHWLCLFWLAVAGRERQRQCLPCGTWKLG